MNVCPFSCEGTSVSCAGLLQYDIVMSFSLFAKPFDGNFGKEHTEEVVRAFRLDMDGSSTLQQPLQSFQQLKISELPWFSSKLCWTLKEEREGNSHSLGRAIIDSAVPLKYLAVSSILTKASLGQE